MGAFGRMIAKAALAGGDMSPKHYAKYMGENSSSKQTSKSITKKTSKAITLEDRVESLERQIKVLQETINRLNSNLYTIATK